MQEEYIILGIDPGFDRLGFGFLGVQGSKVRVIDYGVITTDKALSFEKRLAQIAVDLRELIKEHKPDVMGIETLFFAQNTTTAMTVAEARGVVRLIAAEHTVPIVEFGPSQIKKALTGDGKANKQAMEMMITKLLNLTAVPKPDDAADALAVALTTSTTQWN
jgi:crossover junction endodeoxyribonuclease RuvC